jgi:toxin CcdB
MADLLIRQFDVFRNPEQRRSSVEYIVVLQSDLVSDTRGIIAAPLLASGKEFMSQSLYPRVQVQGRHFAILMTQMSPVPRSLLKEPVTNLMNQRDQIVRALDYLFTGI